MRVMSRVVSLYLPTWPTDRLRRKMGAAAPDAAMPLVLIGQTGRRREVVAGNAAAIEAGLHALPATKAQALAKELVIIHADPVADAAALIRMRRGTRFGVAASRCPFLNSDLGPRLSLATPGLAAGAA
jgi:hypothetical protein